jgi:hypothetical protein
VTSAIPEHPVAFDNLAGEPRNTDLAVLAVSARGRLAISIEAKADEPFGDYIRDVVADGVDRIAHGEDTGIVSRVTGLMSILPQRPKRSPKAGALRYQVLTALGGALAFARDTDALAVLLVHEFVTDQTSPKLRRRNQRDLDRFIRRLSAGAHTRLPAGTILGPFAVNESAQASPTLLYIGKATRVVNTPTNDAKSASPKNGSQP